MLVLSRQRDETIMIGDGIEVRVLRIGREGVRLGVTAPPSIPVLLPRTTGKSRSIILMPVSTTSLLAAAWS